MPHSRSPLSPARDLPDFETDSAVWQVDSESLAEFMAGVAAPSSNRWCEVRRAAEQLALVPGFAELVTLEANTIEEFPHQTDVALKVLRHMGGRAILADEVGLGKTIEAGIILKELAVRGLARRILIITPASLVAQWQGELESKFFERFETPEQPREWKTVDRAIVSLARARHRRHFGAITAEPWDLVIVDEAHKAKNHKSKAYQLLTDLKRDYLLLLTATPLQNDLRELYNLVTLLRPGQFGSWKEFKKRYLGNRRKRIPENPEQIRELAADVMVRTRRSNVDLNLPARHPVHPHIELTGEEAELYQTTTAFLRKLYSEGFHEQSATIAQEDARRRSKRGGKGLLFLELLRFGQRLCSSTGALAESLETKAENEIVLPEFRQKASQLAQFARQVPEQAKLLELDRQLKIHPERVIVFSEHLATVAQILKRVEEHGRAGIRFDGGLSKAQRVAALKRFRSDKRAVFVSTRSGTEGLNLQFANVMINYELPWNPMLVEQRIGRIHRIGQKRPVHIINFAARGTVEERILRVLDEKIRLFELVVGELDVILGRFGDAQELETIVGKAWLESDDDSAFDRHLEKIGSDIEKSRTEGLEQERRSSLIAPPDPGDRLERDFGSLTIPARLRLGYGTKHLKLLDGLNHRREMLGLHVHELQQALEGGTAVVESAGMSEYGPCDRITGVTSRGRAVYVKVAATKLPMWLLELDADAEAPLLRHRNEGAAG